MKYIFDIMDALWGSFVHNNWYFIAPICVVVYLYYLTKCYSIFPSSPFKMWMRLEEVESSPADRRRYAKIYIIGAVNNAAIVSLCMGRFAVVMFVCVFTALVVTKRVINVFYSSWRYSGIACVVINVVFFVGGWALLWMLGKNGF